MMASTHVTFGVTCWAAFERIHGVSILSAPETYLVASIASLLPDIDHPKSWFGSKVPFLSYPISAVFGHRGITHSFIMVLSLIFLMWLYGTSFWLITPMVIGYLSHLGGDMITNSGVPLFWPKKDKVSMPIFNTGGFLELIVRVFLIIILLILIFPGKH
jgi:inner membrane protein